MDTKKLEALAAAVQYGSFTRAAEAPSARRTAAAEARPE